MYPQAEEIGLKTITTAKIPSYFQGSPQNFKEIFTGLTGVPVI